MARASATAENNALTGLVTAASFFGANTADPSTTGANEATYSSGTRAAITWGSPSGGSVANSTAALNLNIASGQTASYFSTWSLSSAGVYQIGGALASSITFVTNGVLSVAIGGLTVAAA